MYTSTILLLTIKFIFLIIGIIITYNSLILKLFIILLLICFCLILRRYSKKRIEFLDLVEFYKIKNNFDLNDSLLIFWLYVAIFIVGIFLLGFYNVGHTVNLKDAYSIIYNTEFYF